MAEGVFNIEEWIKQVWSILNTYNIYDKPVDDNEYKKLYESVCDMFINDLGTGMMKHRNFCMKLLRNLGHYTTTSSFFNPKPDDCNVLYYWIYNSVKKDSVPDKIIDKCFDDYFTHMGEMPVNHNCYHHTYNNMYKEPLKVIKLDIFNSNMYIVKNIIDRKNDPTDSSLQSFICECVKLYYEMNRNYCHQLSQKVKNSDICFRLDLLKRTYEMYLFNTQNKNYKIPSLDDNQNKYLTECQKYLEEQALNTTSLHHDLPIASSRTPNRDSNLDASISLPEGENQSSPMSSTVPTALGTVAGASSILALLYKFSPGRNWIRSGIRGGTGRISSNLYAEQPNEVFYDGFEGEDMSSYNPTYNVGYGSI
ncbi:unnamed protein product [Plasmodium vivax]|uniref:(malaria parasite P. vivax) hypothetical protein n=1 Tax=Plasmodium vivax TaxID=5855 RepID=A0A8S4HBK2_PLAVI|nr:unnamed protein product [Plasmodium vivax]